MLLCIVKLSDGCDCAVSSDEDESESSGDESKDNAVS